MIFLLIIDPVSNIKIPPQYFVNTLIIVHLHFYDDLSIPLPVTLLGSLKIKNALELLCTQQLLVSVGRTSKCGSHSSSRCWVSH